MLGYGKFRGENEQVLCMQSLYFTPYKATSKDKAPCCDFLILQGKASGNEKSLWLRSKLHSRLFDLGSTIQRHAGKFLLLGLIFLGALACCLKSANFETRVEKLWVEGKTAKIKLKSFQKHSVIFPSLFLLFVMVEVPNFQVI